MSEYKANPEIVLAILQTRAADDPFIREVLRGAILEAALMEATTEEPDAGDDTPHD